MAKNLLIVESPAKAGTIEKYLGKDFVVKSSYGHIRDLEKKDTGIKIDKGFEPVYVLDPDKKKLVNELKKLSKDAEMVWLATDEDREGEAISWHLSEALKLEKDKTKRITFNEITKPAILKALENPRDINTHLVNAQQARRVLDRLVGFELSPVLWKKVKPALSAGRVQSVAVRLIVEREREIIDFKPETYFRINGLFNNSKNEAFKAEITDKISDEKSASAILEGIKAGSFSVADLQVKPGKKSPAPPFTTSTLQQEAARKLGFSVSQTMSVAQKLYEAGHITYMRTDSVNLSDTALSGAKAAITGEYGDKYHHQRKYSSKSKGAQEAHE
ncbi:MAG: DNA topoisomerase, partial [Luteibaculum sp.]